MTVRYAVTGSDDHTVKLWDLAALPETSVGTDKTDSIGVIHATADGRRILAASSHVHKPGEIRVLQTDNRSVLSILRGHERGILAMAVMPERRQLLTASYDETFKIWDLESCRCVWTSPRHGAYVNAVAATPDGRRIVSAAGWGGAGDLHVWNLRARKKIAQYAGENIMALGVTSDSRYAVCGGTEGTVFFHNLKVRPKLVPPGRTPLLDKDASVKGHGSRIFAVVITPDGKYAISASADHTILVWDIAETLADLTRLKSLSERAERDESTLIRAAQGIASSRAGVRSQVLWGHRDAVTCLALINNGRYLVSGSRDQTLRVWDLNSGHLETAFTTEHPILACAAAADATIIAGDDSGGLLFFRLEGG